MARKTITKKKTTRKTAKKKIENMEFADGRVEAQQVLATNIEEILTIKSNNPFGTTSFAQFEEKVGDMNLSQMQELAVKASVFPSGNKTSLKNKLKREFKTRFGDSGNTRLNSQSEAPIVDPDSDLAKRIMDILNS